MPRITDKTKHHTNHRRVRTNRHHRRGLRFSNAQRGSGVRSTRLSSPPGTAPRPHHLHAQPHRSALHMSGRRAARRAQGPLRSGSGPRTPLLISCPAPHTLGRRATHCASSSSSSHSLVSVPSTPTRGDKSSRLLQGRKAHAASSVAAATTTLPKGAPSRCHPPPHAHMHEYEYAAAAPAQGRLSPARQLARGWNTTKPAIAPPSPLSVFPIAQHTTHILARAYFRACRRKQPALTRSHLPSARLGAPCLPRLPPSSSRLCP